MAFDPNDPDTKAAIAKITEDMEKRLEAMDAKRAEALDEAKKAKAEARKLKEIDPADLEKLETENEKLRTDLTAAQKAAKDAATAAEKATKALEAESGFTSKLLVENGLRDALVANGVTNAVHQKAAMAMLASGVQIAADGDTRVAKFGDKALGDFVKEWASSDEGKHFVAAPNNGGGGAGGGGGSSGGKVMTRDAFAKIDPREQSTFIKEGGKVVDQAA